VLIRFTQSSAQAPCLPGFCSVRDGPDDTYGVVTEQGNPAWRYVGRDERERELEIVAVELDDTPVGDDVLLVIHVMPPQLRRREQT